MDQDIRFCTTSDGVRIAYAVAGSGPPLVRVPGWVSHLELDEESPSFKTENDVHAQDFTFVRYDKRGTGLSDRDVSDFSVEARLRDLEAVVDDLKLKKLFLYGISEGGPIAMAYAARHPRRVEKLVLYGTFAHLERSPAADALVALVRAEWGLGSDAMTSIFAPDATPEERRFGAKYQKLSATREGAALMLEATMQTNVSELLPQIKAPTLVIHARGDRAIPFEQGRKLAGTIRGARLVTIESANHRPSVAESKHIADVMTEFLLAGSRGATTPASPSAQPEDASVTVMFTDVEGSTALTDRLGDAQAREIIRTHERLTREALAAHGGSEIKTMGDGFMASFPSATRGLQCAIAIQQALAKHNESAAQPINVRIGLNAGEPISENQDLFGTAVNLAARIAARAAGGEILASNVVRELCAGKGFLFADRGEQEMRGFEDTARLYQLRWRE